MPHMGMEDRLISRIDRTRQAAQDRRLELSPTIKQAHERALLEVLHNPDYVIQEKDFESVYGAENIRNDIRETERLAHAFAARDTIQDKHSRQISEVFEAIVLMQSEMSEWLGNAHTLKTSRYDDFKNKTDMIAEWYSPRDGSRVLALAVDVTFSARSVEQKLAAIKGEIDSGSLGTVRYFKDARNDFMGTRNNVPRIVLGASVSTVEELAQLWLKNNKKALGAHPVQRLIIDEMQFQLEAMLKYARSKGNSMASSALQHTLTAIAPVIALKRPMPLGYIERDPVAASIREATSETFGR